MRDFLKSSGRWLSANWFWPLVLLALPNCGLSTVGLPGNFDAGDSPQSSAIMCDVPKVPNPDVTKQCAEASDLGSGISKENAAVALAQGQEKPLMLDFSPAATSMCGGLPKKTQFFGFYPTGSLVCLNCGQQIPSKYSDADKACQAKCVDMVNADAGFELPGGTTVEAFCNANAHVSTNFDKTMCYDNACDGGQKRNGFIDPRTAQELVGWKDQIGTDTESPGNTLVRTAPTTNLGGNLDFNAGAASAQIIEHGDGWVEFSANEIDKQHVLGVSHYPGTKDMDASLADIEFGITLADNGHVFILEKNAAIGGDMGPYTAGERYRVNFKDNNDGTAKITYSRLTASCTPGTECQQDFFASQFNAVGPSYPLRVDTSFKQEGAKLLNVTMVRIQSQE